MGLVLVAYSFKYAKMAEINQGCLPCIFAITTFYICVLFYFKFGEKISAIKIIGTLLMIPCVIFIAMGSVPEEAEGSEESPAAADDDDESYTAGQKQIFAIISVCFAMIAPFAWTVRCLYLRLSEDRYNFNVFDLTIDSQIYQNAIASILYIFYLSEADFKLNILVEGSIFAVFQITGMLCMSLAYRYGPGGPINALTSTQIMYQTVINAFLFNQTITRF